MSLSLKIGVTIGPTIRIRILDHFSTSLTTAEQDTHGSISQSHRPLFTELSDTDKAMITLHSGSDAVDTGSGSLRKSTFESQITFGRENSSSRGQVFLALVEVCTVGVLSGLLLLLIKVWGTLRCLQKEMTTCRHWCVSLWRDPDDVPHCRILFPDKTEWQLISATLCGWRRCFVADQLWWFMTREEED